MERGNDPIDTGRRGRRARGLGIFLVGALAGSLLITPAAAHVSNSVNHLFNTHVKPKLAYELVSAQVTVAAGDNEFLSVSCPGNKVPVGGGIDTLQPNGGHQSLMRIIESYPDSNGWQGFVFNGAPDPNNAHVWAICANVA